MTQRENRELMKIKLSLSRLVSTQTREQSAKVDFGQQICLYVIMLFVGCFKVLFAANSNRLPK